MSAYHDLIARLADKEPKVGYHSVIQIELTDAEVATVVAHEPDVIADAFSVPTEMAKSSIYWAMSCNLPRDQTDMRLAEMLRVHLRVEAKRLVLIDVQDECDRRGAEQLEAREQARIETTTVWFEGNA